MRLIRSLVLAAVGLSLVLATPSVANADGYSVADREEDVARMEVGHSAQLADGPRTVDVVSLAVTHTADVVRFRIFVRRIDSVTNFFAVAAIDAKDGTFIARLTRGRAGARVALFNSVDAEGPGTRVHCDGIWGAVRQARQFVSVAVPRDCIGDPKFVRTAAGMGASRDSGTLTFWDDAAVDGLATGLTFGGKLRSA